MHAVFGFDRVIFAVLDDFFLLFCGFGLFFFTVLRFLIDLNAPFYHNKNNQTTCASTPLSLF